MVVMDAWLPPFAQDWRGHSLAVIRNRRLVSVIDQLRDAGRVACAHISPEEIKNSQKGLIAKKRSGLAKRLHLLRLKETEPPRKRVEPDPSVRWIDRTDIWLRRALQNQSKLLWQRYGDAHRLARSPRIRFLIVLLYMLHIRVRLKNLAEEPQRLAHYVRRRLKRV